MGICFFNKSTDRSFWVGLFESIVGWYILSPWKDYKMKVIEISNCIVCPYHEHEMADMFTEGGYFCDRHDKYISKQKPTSFPIWCTLKEKV